MSHDLSIPSFLRRPKGYRPGSLESRRAAAKAAGWDLDSEPGAFGRARSPLSDGDARALAEIEAIEAEQKKLRAEKSVAARKAKREWLEVRAAELRAMRAIPDEFRAWDPVRCRWFDTRKMKEEKMSKAKTDRKVAKKRTVKKAVAKKRGVNAAKNEVRRMLKEAGGKPIGGAKAPAKKAPAKAGAVKTDGLPWRGKTAIVMALMLRDGGASRSEILEATGWPAINVLDYGKKAVAKGYKFRDEKTDGPVIYSLEAPAS